MRIPEHSWGDSNVQRNWGALASCSEHAQPGPLLRSDPSQSAMVSSTLKQALQTLPGCAKKLTEPWDSHRREKSRRIEPPSAADFLSPTRASMTPGSLKVLFTTARVSLPRRLRLRRPEKDHCLGLEGPPRPSAGGARKGIWSGRSAFGPPCHQGCGAFHR